MSLYYFEASRSQEQLDKMIDLENRGVCIFCPEHIEEDSEKLIIKTKNWMVKANAHPYNDTKLHLLLIPTKHVNTLSKLSKAAQEEFIPLISRLEKLYKLTSYGVAIRSGDMRFNGGSIEHLHAHIIVGNTDNPKHEPIRVKLSSRPKS